MSDLTRWTVGRVDAGPFTFRLGGPALPRIIVLREGSDEAPLVEMNKPRVAIRYGPDGERED